MTHDSPLKRRRKKSRKPRPAAPGEMIYVCPCCRREVRFVWRCNCGFTLCQDCMLDNAWGLTCNHVTWTCPDCGSLRSY